MYGKSLNSLKIKTIVILYIVTGVHVFVCTCGISASTDNDYLREQLVKWNFCGICVIARYNMLINHKGTIDITTEANLRNRFYEIKNINCNL